MAFPNIVLWLFVQLFNASHGKTYEKVRSLYREKIYSLSYSTDIRPVFNQSSIIHVSMNFEIISIVQVNDVFQSITLNGFVNFNWTDEVSVGLDFNIRVGNILSTSGWKCTLNHTCWKDTLKYSCLKDILKYSCWKDTVKYSC